MSHADPQPLDDDFLDRARERMLQRVAQAVRDQRVLDAMREVPREQFVPAHLRHYAYEDGALPIGEEQTISQPLIVGMMSEALQLSGGETVLEIGTGSGYQAAVLARLARLVVSVEIVDALRERARRTLQRLGVTNVEVLAAGDAIGAPQRAPFDAILVTAAAPRVPAELVEQLRTGGQLAIPVGSRREQELLVVTRTAEGHAQRTLGAVRFVPLRGAAGFDSSARRGESGEASQSANA